MCHDLFFGHFLFYFVVLVFCCLVCFTSGFCLVSLQFSPSPVFYQLIMSSVFILPWVPLFSARLSCLLLVSCLLVFLSLCLLVCFFYFFFAACLVDYLPDSCKFILPHYQ
ncbi:hypothetical protein LDENG_00128140 [Lucifuga dentata]|nr:hypothetical protein LDENG_00128140 [Lucifuga dentata]